MTNSASNLSQLSHGHNTSGQTVSLGYGKANFPGTLATYSCMKTTAPFARVTAITSGKRHGKPVHEAAGTMEHHGGFTTGSVEHPNGTVILLQASWKRGGAPLRDAALFMRLRAGAPLYRVNAFVPTNMANTYGDRVSVFCGYADIMSNDELQLLGIQVNRSYSEKFMDFEEVDECYEIIELMPESQGRPQLSAIATPTGIELREVAQAPQRRLVLRGRK